jgi:flagellar protein FliO/FliZ
MPRYAFLAALTFGPAGLACAQTAAAAPPSAGASLLQMLVGLAVVVASIIAALYVVKRLSGPRGAAGNLLRIVSTTAVGPRERVMVVEVGDTWLVVGVAPGQVRALHSMPRTALPQAATTATGPAPDFGTRLRNVLERKPREG